MRALFLTFACFYVAHASFLSKIFSGFRNNEEENYTLLPKVLPSDDTSYLISFESDDYDHCQQMQPVLKRLESDLGTFIRRINIARRREFMGVLEAIGHNDCNTLPFYYNRRTGQAVCGATSYANLRKWGTGDLRHMFMDPPESLSQTEDNYIGPSSRKSVGTKGFLLDKMQILERRGKSRVDKARQLEELRRTKALEKEQKEKSVSKRCDKKKVAASAIINEPQKPKQQSAAERLASRKAARETK